VKERYTYTPEALQGLELSGLSAPEVWAVLHSSPRLTRHVSEDAAAIFGITPAGRHLVVLVAESPVEDNDWDILAARDMYPDEVEVFDGNTGRTS
jgi:hypothetical protein